MMDDLAFIPEDEREVLEHFHALHDHIQSLPTDRKSYGLIHRDAHLGNMLIDNSGKITLSDFDDCAYSWFVDDIAIVLFYASMWSDDAAAFTASFMPSFLRGYAHENGLAPEWLGEIGTFLKLREIELYAVIHRSFDMSNLQDPWCAAYMNGRRERIEHGIPYIDFPLETLSDHLVP